MRLFRLLLSSLLLSTSVSAQPIVLEGEVPADGDFFDVPFEVPAGTVELEVRHDDLSSENILDWGLEDPEGFRGYGGGNTEPAVVGERAASRSYLAGPLPAGTWRVTVGKAKIAKTPARYRIEVHLHTTATLPPQPERRAYAPVTLSTEARWYAGDFHVHSRESGDAQPPLDEIAHYARARGLDFVHLSDHNTTSTLDFLADAQARHPELLLVPGVEYTTYAGHANAIGATGYVSPRLAAGGSGMAAVTQAFAEQGAVFSINHPVYDVGDMCIGCAWRMELPRGGVGAVEIATGGFDKVGRLFNEGAIAYWDFLLAQGHHLAALGGSDDHRAGEDTNLLQSPIGDPTTRVFANGLSVAALLEGVRASRTVVKMGGPEDPIVSLETDVERTGDTALTERARLTATVTGAKGQRVRWVHNGVGLPFGEVDSDAFVLEREVQAPAEGEDRYRVEVWVEGRPRTVTSHVWVSRSAEFRGVPATPPEVPATQGCGCGAGAGGSAGVLALGLLALVRRRKRLVH
ncbi:MAG: CehA/McbA family metallohydrolase [Myxococcaceae bacterium]|nr:CehA/McbA family metallohydrolase [Myxococcaceae bacterium]